MNKFDIVFNYAVGGKHEEKDDEEESVVVYVIKPAAVLPFSSPSRIYPR